MIDSNDSTRTYHASIPEVIGDVDVASLQEMLQQKCGASVVEADAARMSEKEDLFLD